MTTHPTPAALLAECAALLPSLQWCATGGIQADLPAAFGISHDGHRVLVCVVFLSPERAATAYSVEVSHRHTNDPTGDGGIYAWASGATRALTLREAYTIARDRYDHARAVPRPDFPEVS